MYKSYLFFIFNNFREIPLQQITIGSEHFDNSFCKSFHISVPNSRILTLKLLEDFKALCELSKNINNRAGKVGVLRVFSEAIFFVSVVGTMEKLQGNVVILVEPLHDEGLKPFGILGDLSLVRRDVCHIGFVQPLNPKVEMLGSYSRLIWHKRVIT